MSNATVALDTREMDGILIVPLDKQLRMRYSTNYRWFEPPFREFTNFYIKRVIRIQVIEKYEFPIEVQ